LIFAYCEVIVKREKGGPLSRRRYPTPTALMLGSLGKPQRLQTGRK
jgi:hypothetical protein